MSRRKDLSFAEERLYPTHYKNRYGGDKWIRWTGGCLTRLILLRMKFGKTGKYPGITEVAFANPKSAAKAARWTKQAGWTQL